MKIKFDYKTLYINNKSYYLLLRSLMIKHGYELPTDL